MMANAEMGSSSLSQGFLVLVFTIQMISGSIQDTINTTQMIRDGETIVSSDGLYELGFFSPGKSMNRYVGMWFHKTPDRTVVWVANRHVPLRNKSGVLKLTEPGILVLLDNTIGTTIWSSNASSRSVQNPVAQLLDNGNLVVREESDHNMENYLWQSFDYPTDTFLPGMKFGTNFATGLSRYLWSWKSNEDPSPGDYRYVMDQTGYPQIYMIQDGVARSRAGPWNGILFSGSNAIDDTTYNVTYVMNEKEIYYRERTIDTSVVIRFTLSQSGVAQRWTWVPRTQEWRLYSNFPADNCDTYNVCGAYGSCDIAKYPSCRCLDKFVPRDPESWVGADWSSGCVRRTNLSCKGDGFLRYSGIKLPESRRTRHKERLTLQECREECLTNCSCTAYTQLDLSNRSGCLFWFHELVDMRELPKNGQDLFIYIRMAASELEQMVNNFTGVADVARMWPKKLGVSGEVAEVMSNCHICSLVGNPQVLKSHAKGNKKGILIGSLSSVIGMVILALGLFLYIRKRRKKSHTRKKGRWSESDLEDSDLPLFKYSDILVATNYFSKDNKVGEGGFGPVFKGTLEDGQEIAVKRLSRTSTQGVGEFKNEVIFIAKLQHRNLVRLLGCCIQGEENMLIYEYMPHGSLDIILFDETRNVLLDWKKRFHIINGVARGLLYLHQDSRLRIIHRDLKASNILLDFDMNPKISDFGTARCFRGNEIAAKTCQVVGTYGYMSPEYVIDGLFSIKSDVFSFGVLVLEIISGKKNRGFSHDNDHLNLLGHAWKLYKEDRVLELVDISLAGIFDISEVIRTIHIGLLCVQKNPKDRPEMYSVNLMLGSDGELPNANQPGFFIERETAAQSSTCTTNSINELSITMPQGR